MIRNSSLRGSNQKIGTLVILAAVFAIVFKREELILQAGNNFVSAVMFNCDKIIMHTVNFASTNLRTIVTSVWYGMIAATSFMTCMILRTIINAIRRTVDNGAGSIMAVLANTTLAATISLNLGDICMTSKNTPAEEMILCSAMGYYLYEMFFLMLAESFQDRCTALRIVAVTSFIVNCLWSANGATVHILFLFLWSSSVLLLKLPSFGSTYYVNSVAYKLSVWAGYASAVHQRLILGLSMSYKLWASSKFRIDEYLMPLWISIYCAALCCVFYGLDVIHKREKESKKKDNLERLGIDASLKRNVVCAYE